MSKILTFLTFSLLSTSLYAATFSWPIYGKITSYFGQRSAQRFHYGIDITAKSGTPIRVMESGIVSFAGRLTGYGLVIIVEHRGLMSLYAHCSRLLVQQGEMVERAQIIAQVGHTGNARGPHLHFEVINEDDEAIDPMLILGPPEIEQLATSTCKIQEDSFFCRGSCEARPTYIFSTN